MNSLPKEYYNVCFQYNLGSEEKLLYNDGSLDFIICSCVIQHLNSFDELSSAIKEMTRVLSLKGRLYLMFKAGTNDTDLSHFNSYYQEQRTFRVFHPDNVIDLGKQNNLKVISKENLLDSNWIPYCCIIFQKNKHII